MIRGSELIRGRRARRAGLAGSAVAAGMAVLSFGVAAECLGQSTFTKPAAEFENSYRVAPAFDISVGGPPVGPAVLDESSAYIAASTRVIAVNFTSGDARWQVQTDVAWPLSVWNSLVLVAGSQSVTLLRADDGTRRWSTRVPQPIAVAPAFKDGMIFVGLTNGDLIALRAGDGSMVWTYHLSDVPSLSPVASQLAVFAASQDGAIACVEIDRGTLRWVRRLPASAASIAIVGATLVLGGNDKCLYAQKTASGANRWPKRQIGARPAGPAVGDAKNIYYVALDNIVWALNRRNGNVRWRQLLPYRPLGGPQLLGANLGVAVVGPEFYLFTPSDGEQVAAFAVDVAEARTVSAAQQMTVTAFAVTSSHGRTKAFAVTGE